jgi:hypothetical protein
MANLYMRRFVLGWKKLGLERSLGSRIVTYADDFVIPCSATTGATAQLCSCRVPDTLVDGAYVEVVRPSPQRGRAGVRSRFPRSQT